MNTRLAFERMARCTALACALVLLWSVTRAARRDAQAVDVDVSSLASELPRITKSGARAVHVAMDRQPTRAELDWLAALSASGTRVTWSGDVPALAIATSAIADPVGSARVAWESDRAAPSFVTIGDSVPLANPRGAIVRAGTPPVSVAANGWHAHASPFATRPLGDIVVLGAASWESRFVVDALEERGWRVAARLETAPGIAVQQGEPVVDIAHAAVVVLLDSTARVPRVALDALLARGGGVVLAGTAARIATVGSLAPARLGAHVAGRPHLVTDTVDLRSVGHFPLLPDDSAGIVVARLNDGVSVVAKRVGAGRVIQVGADETWRWRMEGDDEAPAAHRAWWASIIAAAGPTSAQLPNDAAEPWAAAPRAAIIAALGAPAAQRPAAAPRGPRPTALFLLAVTLVLLLIEWLSRRLRGAA